MISSSTATERNPIQARSSPLPISLRVCIRFEMRRNDAALAPRSSHAVPILVSNLPAESISLQPTEESDWGTFGYLDWSISRANRPSAAQ
jgi:hypothetical protein